MADFHGAGRRASKEIVPESAALIAFRQQLFGGITQ
jgi:hypothetical protein